jgi:hypothetical protein
MYSKSWFFPLMRSLMSALHAGQKMLYDRCLPSHPLEIASLEETMALHQPLAVHPVDFREVRFCGRWP